MLFSGVFYILKWRATSSPTNNSSFAAAIKVQKLRITISKKISSCILQLLICICGADWTIIEPIY